MENEGEDARRSGVNKTTHERAAEITERFSAAADRRLLDQISHELRNGVTIVEAAVSIFRDEGDDLGIGARPRLFWHLERATGRLARLINNVFLIVRPTSTPAVTEPVLLPQLIDKVRSAFTARQPERPIVVQVARPLPLAGGDPSHLEHVLSTLISEADYLNRPEAAIDVLAEPAGPNEILVSVCDRRTDSEAAQVESTLRWLDDPLSAERVVTAPALGLAVCKRLVESHGGRIWSTPLEGGGVRVNFTVTNYRSEFA